MQRKIFRIVLIGNASVGKTSLYNYFAHGRCDLIYQPTLGAGFYSTEDKENNIQYQIWDTSGEEKYNSLAPLYFHNASAAILVFDLTSQMSFEKVNEWIKKFRDVAGSTAPVIVAGNKVDLSKDICIIESVASDWASKNGLAFFQTSAATGQNVKALFSYVFSIVNRTKPIITDEKQQNGSDSRCC